jgi:CheY-like chemotaxis protein
VVEMMALNRSIDDQAVALFLAEAGELFQQFEEGLLLLAHEPSPLNLKKIVRSAQAIHQGAGQVELVDLQLLALGLDLLLECYGEDLAQGQAAIASDLLHHLCDNLQCSLIVHRSRSTSAEGTHQREFVLNALMPKALDILKLMLAQPIRPQARQQLLQQQTTQWIQWWSNGLDLAELKTIADATLSATAAFPHAAEAIATLALAGFQVAHEATIQRLNTFAVPLLESLPEAKGTEPQSFYHQERSPAAATTLDLSQHLAGLAHHAIFCVATQSIVEIVLLQPGQRQHKDGQDYLLWQDRLLVLHRFTDLWRQNAAISQVKNSTPPTDELVLVLRHEPAPLALALEVDRLIVEPELALGQPEDLSLTLYNCGYGWTCMDDGSWIEVVDVNCLIQARLNPDTPINNPRSTVSSRTENERGVTFLENAISLKNPQLNTPKTILVVDDSKTVREILSLTLQQAGYCVVQAKDGQAAIAQLEQQAHIHLTICDLEMSNLNGFEFLRHRLQDQRWTQIPVLILSSHTSEEYRQLAQKLGAADYLSIPYDPSLLLETIQRLIQRSPMTLI